MDKPQLDKLKYLINKKKTLDEISFILNEEISEVLKMIDFLNSQVFCYEVSGNEVLKHSIGKEVGQYNFPHLDNKRLCLLSDTHYGSLYDRPDIIEQIFYECERREISTIFCAGDFTNGCSYKKTYNIENKVNGVNAMVDYVINTHPYVRGITFYTIGGNHDALFKKYEGVDIIELIAQQRDDIVYLGQDMADIYINGLYLRIFHGYGSNVRSLKERVSRCFDNMDFALEPDILQLGHIHHSLYMPISNTHIFQTGALIDPNSYHKNNRLPFERSCWFVQMEYDEGGNLTKVIPEYMSFGERKRVKRH